MIINTDVNDKKTNNLEMFTLLTIVYTRAFIVTRSTVSLLLSSLFLSFYGKVQNCLHKYSLEYIVRTETNYPTIPRYRLNNHKTPSPHNRRGRHQTHELAPSPLARDLNQSVSQVQQRAHRTRYSILYKRDFRRKIYSRTLL